eukprot:CAMPEP_0117448268 /NCGR_PEP_ID=MMETSP0759-20121206/7311_1 /TAXON_ID=63605 /ORGANISM="Percolomonas cosmopolitus, Strain WS" /LENGTH=1039 /DNA_ID=CAMNT_0005240645 /DNA_START=11 /DNA_END=3126 /DNA_ORIENTATION=+
MSSSNNTPAYLIPLFPPDSFQIIAILPIHLIKKTTVSSQQKNGAAHKSGGAAPIPKYHTSPRLLVLTLKKKKKQRNILSPRLFLVKEVLTAGAASANHAIQVPAGRASSEGGGGGGAGGGGPSSGHHQNGSGAHASSNSASVSSSVKGSTNSTQSQEIGMWDRGRALKLKRLERVNVRLLIKGDAMVQSYGAKSNVHLVASGPSTSLYHGGDHLLCTLSFQMYKPVEFLVGMTQTPQSRHNLLIFLAKMMKLCEDNFGNTPQLIGALERTELMVAMEGLDTMELGYGAFASNADGSAQEQQEQFVTEDEERTLKRVLEQHSLDVSDPKTVMRVLTERLKEMETQNIHEILEKQHEWSELIEQIRVTRTQLLGMKLSLESYQNELRKLKTDISQIEQKNNEMDVQSTNHEKLKEELQQLAMQFDFSKSDERIIQDWKFENEQQLVEIKKLVHRIESALTRDLGHGMDQMLAVQQRRDYLKDLRKQLVDRFIVFLQKQFTSRATQLLRDAHKNLSKDLVDQREIIYDLKRYEELMPSVKRADISDRKYYAGYLQLLNAYAQAMSDPYQGQLKLFFRFTRNLIARNEESKAGNMFFLGNTRSIGTGRGAGTSSRSSLSSPLSMSGATPSTATSDDDSGDLTSIGDNLSTFGGGGTVFSSTEDKRVDQAFSIWLSDLCELIFMEEKFCCQFFLLDPEHEAYEKKELKKMMDRMFKPLVTSSSNLINKLLTWIEKKTDLFYSLPMLNEVEGKIARYTDQSSFVPDILQKIMTDLNQKIFTKFKERQCASIMAFRHLTKKLSVVPYVSQFPHFVERMEKSLSDNGDEKKRHHAEHAYQTILSTMFTSLEKLAKMDSKHYNQFCLKNYAFFSRVVSKHNTHQYGPEVGKTISPTIEEYVQKSRLRFEECLHRYVVLTIRYRFGALFDFFEGIEECRKTIGISDVKFQNAFTSTKLNELIKRYQVSYKRDIEDCLKRMDKHIGPKSERSSVFKVSVTDYALFGEVWTQLREYFLQRYQDFSILVRKCYTNLKLEPDPVMMTRAFAEV